VHAEVNLRAVKKPWWFRWDCAVQDVFFLNPTACSSGCNQTPKGGIWLGLSSKDLLILQLKTKLYAGLWLKVESFKQYCIESFWRRTYRGGSFASMQMLDDDEVR